MFATLKDLLSSPKADSFDSEWDVKFYIPKTKNILRGQQNQLY